MVTLGGRQLRRVRTFSTSALLADMRIRMKMSRYAGQRRTPKVMSQAITLVLAAIGPVGFAILLVLQNLTWRVCGSSEPI
jgi:hypothetical protein